MIAKNFRLYPDAMALQLVLAFGRCTWHTARPTTRQGRAVRAERSRLVKQTPQVVRWVAKAVPTWWREAKRRALTLAKVVKRSLLALVWDEVDEGPEDGPSDGTNEGGGRCDQERASAAVVASLDSRYSNWGEFSRRVMTVEREARNNYRGMLFTYGLHCIKAHMDKRDDGRRSLWISPAGDFLCKGYR